MSLGSLRTRLFAPVDAASVGFFRAAFGAILCIEVVGFVATGKIASDYDPERLHFPYPGFSWATPLPVPWIHVHFLLTGLAALALALGVARRLAAILFLVGFAWIFLLDQALYLNHFYLVLLYALLMVCIPGEASISLPARRGERTLPAWCLTVLRTQMGLVYLFAGIAKLNPDWLQGQPVRIWLAARAERPVLGPLLASEPAVWIVAYGGLALDLCAWPLLAWRRTRTLAFCLLCAFHLSNGYLFGIGIFPWFALAATTLFFEPDWPRRLLRRWQAPSTPPPEVPTRWPQLVLCLLAVWLVLQVVIPLRHFAYPGSPSWSEEGHRFAWHMMLRSKRGYVVFEAEDESTGATRVVPHEELLTERQMRKVPGRPEMLVHLARHLAQREGTPEAPVRIHAYPMVSLNGRTLSLLVDPEVDLARTALSWRPAPWVLPLTEPLKP